MNERLGNILMLALRPETGEGESVAALLAARRLVAKQGIDQVWTMPSEKIVYKDRVVYCDFKHTHNTTYTLKVSARFLHSMLEHIFQDAEHCECMVKLLECHAENGTLLGRTVIKFQVHGTPVAIKQYEDMINDYVERMNDRAPPTVSEPPKSKGWFARWFKA